MLVMVQQEFSGENEKAIALAHAQVSEDSFAFFVVRPDVAESVGMPTMVINASIVTKEAPCESFEGCMSFPHRKQRRVPRYAEIEVIYETPNERGKLEPRREKYAGLLAIMFQHEVQHAMGKNIFYAE